MPDYLVRLVQMHESFRQAELQALADIAEVSIEFVQYEEEVSTCSSTFFFYLTIAVSFLHHPSAFGCVS